MRTTLEDRKEQYRIIYELLYKKARIKVKEIASVLGINRNAASRRLKEAFELNYILTPQIRKCSYANLKEYMYLINCKYPFDLYNQYLTDPNVVYHAVMGGFANLWVISTEKIHIKGDILFEGYRSDYSIAYAPYHTWEKAIQIMHTKVEEFNPDAYTRNTIIKTHWDESIPWSTEDEILYREFKYNMRKNLSPLMKKHLISGQKIYEFLEKTTEYCTVFTRFFPETMASYDPYLFIFETDYEDFIIDVFSQLPTSSFFFKVSDRLFMYAEVDRQFLRNVGLNTEISRLHIPLLVRDMLKKGILTNEAHAIIEYHWNKDR